MKARGHIKWTYTNRSAGKPKLSLRIHPKLVPRDEAIFLLHVASEIEHSLMVQYLYAAFSIGNPLDPIRPLTNVQRAKISDWQQKILGIAKQEMGHWATVHNLVIAIGGAPTFDRESFPYRSDFYPFPFKLERLSKDSLAKYIAAEMPPFSALASWPRRLRRHVKGIIRRARRGLASGIINRVGVLYERIYEVVDSLDPSLFSFDTAQTFQALAGELEAIGVECQPPDCDPLERIFLWPADSKQRALEAIKMITAQGEAPDGPLHGVSHFEQFLTIYDDGFPEHNPRYGPVEHWNPNLMVPDDPTTETSGPWNASQLNAPAANLVGVFFNLRYRLLLETLCHYFMLDRSQSIACKTFLAKWSLNIMRDHIGPLAFGLGLLSQQLPELFLHGQRSVAAAPFEMPYTLALSLNPLSRWRAHIDVIDASAAYAFRTLNEPDLPQDLKDTVQGIVDDDHRVRQKVTDIISDPAHNCPVF